jgi:hypothetical protein
MTNMTPIFAYNAESSPPFSSMIFPEEDGLIRECVRVEHLDSYRRLYWTTMLGAGEAAVQFDARLTKPVKVQIVNGNDEVLKHSSEREEIKVATSAGTTTRLVFNSCEVDGADAEPIYTWRIRQGDNPPYDPPYQLGAEVFGDSLEVVEGLMVATATPRIVAYGGIIHQLEARLTTA